MKSSRVVGVCVVLALLAPVQERPAAAPRLVRQSGLAAADECDSHVGHRGRRRRIHTSERDAWTRRRARARAHDGRAASRSAASRSRASRPRIQTSKSKCGCRHRSWNGKFQAVGNGGWAGTIPYPAMAAAMARGYATASTDSGHTTPGASFAVGHPEKLVDYAHRSLHEMAVQRQSGRRRVLRQTGDRLGVERLLHGRKPGADARVDVPERLRCHRRRRAAGHPIARARRAPRAASLRSPHGRQLHSAREVSGRSQSGDGCVRCEGRRERRRPRESSRRAASIRRCCNARMRTARRA